MASKIVTVVQTTVMTVEIPDDRLTPEAIDEFEAGMFDVEGNPDNLFGYAATMAVKGYTHAEGLGVFGRDIKIQELDQMHDIYLDEVTQQ